jgi:hypothetical protein
MLFRNRLTSSGVSYPTSKVLVLFIAAYLFACSNSLDAPTGSVKMATRPSKCEFPQNPLKASGAEVTVQKQPKARNSVLIILKNTSEVPVYMAYSPPRDSGALGSVSFTREKRSKSGVYSAEPSELDHAPRLEPIKPNEEIRYEFLESSSGDYRLTFRYLIDSSVVAVLNDPDCFFKLSDAELSTSVDIAGKVTIEGVLIR